VTTSETAADRLFEEEPSPRSPGISVQEYLRHDSRPVPAVLQYDRNDDLGTENLSIDRYISREWHDREVVKVWRKVWQFACRTDHIPEVGDHYLYEVADDSIIVMRTAPDEIKAYFNACLHRGRQLRTSPGRVSELRCPFHGMTWNLDGTNKNLPCSWDFPQVKQHEFNLPEAKVAIWNGFVFLNMDPEAEPLEDFLGTMVDDWQRWDYSRNTVYSHIAARIACNWKVAGEAFIEGWHVLATHPQLLEWMGDENTQYDVIKGQNWNRQIVPQGVPSPAIADQLSEQDILDSYYETRAYYQAGHGRDLSAGDEGTPQVPPGSSARAVLAQAQRETLSAQFGRSFDEWTDSELLDGIQYFVFPNFYAFAGPRTNAIYRFLPDGNDPDRCIAEVWLLAQPPADGVEPPAPKPVRWLQEGETFSDITEIGLLGPVFDQDYANLPHIQKGLKTTRSSGVVISRYQENRIRHYHQILEEWLAR
jgi:phenylpropionate dioxygenase-like ring-hydroxylating dioxygenase large terminal subunit